MQADKNATAKQNATEEALDPLSNLHTKINNDILDLRSLGLGDKDAPKQFKGVCQGLTTPSRISVPQVLT